MIELWRSVAGRRALVSASLALGLVLAAGGCGGAEDAEPEVAVDSLSLLDRELDLAMSADEAAAELRDRPSGTQGAGASPESPPVRRPPPSAPPPPAPDRSTPREEAPEEAEISAAGPADEGAPAEVEADAGPRFERRSIGAGKTFEVTLNQELSTRHNRVGDLFSANLVHPLTDGRLVLVPEGAKVLGEVTAVQESGGHGQTAIINLAIHEVSFGGDTYPMAASILEANPETRGRSSTGAKAAKIGGAAVVGAILGRVIGGDAVGTIIGTAVGGAAGTAIVLGTEDVDAVLPRGSRMVLGLDAPLELEVEVP